LCHAPNGPVSNITILNISTQGCCVQGEDLPAVGQECELVFEWRGQRFRTEIEVVWKKPDGQAGFEFLSMDEKRLATLRDLCATLRCEPLSEMSPERAAEMQDPAQKQK
jgi:hypothetical protein